MPNAVVLLKGVNVGGRQMLSMKDAKRWMVDVGYKGVSSYLNSGNILFELSSEPNLEEKRLQDLFKEKSGILLTLYVLTKDEVERIVNESPFDEVSEPDNTKRVIHYFSYSVGDETVWEVYKDLDGDIDYYLKGRLVYAYYKKGVGRSKVRNDKIKRLMKHDNTARNWNTVISLYKLLKP